MSDADSTREYRTDPAGGDERLDLDTVFDLLSNQRRRFLLYALSEATEATVDGLAREVSERDEADRTTVEVSLRHVHLPALAEAGVVDYAAGASTVGYDGDAFLDSMLERTAAVDRGER